MAHDEPAGPAGIRVELDDPRRLDELCDYFQRVQAVAVRDGRAVVVRFPGPPASDDVRQLRAYLDTWVALEGARGRPVVAQVRML